LKENPELANELEGKLRRTLGLASGETAEKSVPASVVAEAPREKEKARR
jgi:hypothetical protein